MEGKDEYICSLLLSLFLMQGEINRLNETLDLARKGELVYINNPQIKVFEIENNKLKEEINKLGKKHENYCNIMYWQMKEQIDGLEKKNAKLKAENMEIKISYINFIAKLKREMITKDDIQDLKNTVKKFVEERNSLRLENERLKEATDGLLKIQYTLADSCKKYEQTLQQIKEIAERVREIFKSLTDRIEQNDYVLFTELEYLKEQTNENN